MTFFYENLRLPCLYNNNDNKQTLLRKLGIFINSIKIKKFLMMCSSEKFIMK
jgi:hypothetical protein